MTLRPEPSDFLIGGNVRTVDLLDSIAKEIDRINNISISERAYHADRTVQFQRLARQVRRLAETIEKGRP